MPSKARRRRPRLPPPTARSTGTTWPAGCRATSGGVGQVATGVYYVQLDSAGGGVETCLPGDANLDGTVDINDLTIVLAHYNQTGMGWTQGEFTGDGTVDINDLTIVLAHYNQSVGAGILGRRARTFERRAVGGGGAVGRLGDRTPTSGGVSQVLKAAKASMRAPPRFRGGRRAPTPRAARCFFVCC